MRVLIAGVGYHNLSDLSFGPHMVNELRALEWRNGVEIDDWSFGPIAVTQRLQDRPGYYDRIIFISAVQRGREAGALGVYCWNGALPDAAEIQRRIGEAVMGVISLDNLLIVTTHFRALPKDVIVIEVEPENLEFGEAFTPRVQAAIPKVSELARAYATSGTDSKA